MKKEISRKDFKKRTYFVKDLNPKVELEKNKKATANHKA
jgi:hypothetical protein